MPTSVCNIKEVIAVEETLGRVVHDGAPKWLWSTASSADDSSDEQTVEGSTTTECETIGKLWSRLTFIVDGSDAFGIFKTQIKGGRKIAARIRASKPCCSKNFTSDAEREKEHTEATSLGHGFMRKHLGSHADDNLSQLINFVE